MKLFEDVIVKPRASHGRVRVATLFGATALVTVIALLVGVLPVSADSSVDPAIVNEGGGDGKCFVETGDLPSAATNDYHNNNPKPGVHTSADGAIQITVTDTSKGRVFRFDVLDHDFVVYDVVVNGGPKSNHYDYDGNGGPVSSDVDLHAPNQGPNKYYNLSHINVCYDVRGLTDIPCDVQPPIRVEGDGILRIGDVTIFQNSIYDCTDKRATFFIEDDVATLAFVGDGTDTVAGRLEIHKDFGNTDFEDLTYQRTDSDPFVDVEWCEIREKDTTPDTEGLFDGDEFDDVLETDEYPSLVGVTDGGGAAISCKVFEGENAAGIQVTVVYFELEDPNWK